MFQAFKIPETGELLVLFCVDVFGFPKIFILCASLYLNFESGKNASWKDCLLEKSLIETMPTPHFVFQPQTVHCFRSIKQTVIR